VISCHDSTSRLCGAEVDRFVWNAWRHEKKVSGLTDYLVLKGASPTSENSAFQHIDACFVPNVNVWLGLRTWWNDNEVHGQTCSANSGTGDADEVGQALPCHYSTIWPKALDLLGCVVHGISTVSERLVWRLTIDVSGTQRRRRW